MAQAAELARECRPVSGFQAIWLSWQLVVASQRCPGEFRAAAVGKRFVICKRIGMIFGGRRVPIRCAIGDIRSAFGFGRPGRFSLLRSEFIGVRNSPGMAAPWLSWSGAA